MDKFERVQQEINATKELIIKNNVSINRALKQAEKTLKGCYINN